MTPRRRALLLSFVAVLWGSAAAAQNPDPEVYDEPAPEKLEPVEVAQAPLPKTDLTDPKTVEPALHRAFDAPGGFCKSADHELTSSEASLCDVASAGALRCPGFVSACERRAAARSKHPSNSRGSDHDAAGHRARRARSGDGRDGTDSSGDDDGGYEISTGSSGPLGELIGGIIRVVVWALIAIGVGAMLVAGIRALLGRRRDPDDGSKAEGDATVAKVPRPLVTGSPEELLARARELALAGEIKGAMALVLRALLRHLEIGGVLELHPSRTNGDYVRSLRRQGHRVDELRRVSAEVEAIEFGGARPSPEAFSALHARVAKLVQVAGFVLVLLSLGVLGGCRKRASSENAVNSCGSAANGYSAFCETLAARGVKVRRRFTSVEKVASDVTRIVVLEDEIDATERAMLLNWVADGGTLVVFDPDKAYIGLVSEAHPPCGDELVLEPSFWNVPAASAARIRLPGMRTFEDQGSTRLAARCERWPVAVEASRGAGTIIAVADGRLPMNASLAIDQNAALVATLAGPPGSTVELVGAWTGSGTDLPLESIARSGLLPWFLQILALGFAIALYRGAPFGSRREPISVTRRAFAEHAIALGDAYSRVRASRIALVNYGSYALERLRVRLQETKHGRLTDLAGAIAARHQVSEAEVMSLVVAVRSAEDQAHDSATETEHLAALRRLAALVKKTGGSS